MDEYSQQQQGQDFYQSGYDLDDGLQHQQQQYQHQHHQQQQQAPSAAWQGQGGHAQAQWTGGGEGQQVYYPSGSPYEQHSPQQQEYMQSGSSGVGGMERSESDVGSLGHMDSGSASGAGGGGGGADSYGGSFDDEPPLLQELGIDFNLIKRKALSVLNPIPSQDYLELSKEADLAGPLFFCLLFGVVLLLSGKVHFGYIYGVSFLGCVSMYMVLNLMSLNTVDASCVVSVLGYCLLPMVGLSCISIFLHLQGVLGIAVSLVVIIWCSYAASNLFVHGLDMRHKQFLVAYPCALLYGVFALLTIF